MFVMILDSVFRLWICLFWIENRKTKSLAYTRRWVCQETKIKKYNHNKKYIPYSFFEFFYIFDCIFNLLLEIECLLIFLTGAKIPRQWIIEDIFLTFYQAQLSYVSYFNFKTKHVERLRLVYTKLSTYRMYFSFLNVTGPNSVCLETYKRIKWKSSCYFKGTDTSFSF